ncbi:D-ribose pyranase [Spiroplasma sp. SV19]|uniref:D-ribose pyranase n=1 Tax=Spiroplasma sp. SV19 TaxID=2570468 RepID=UPI0024B7E0C9|nr:D-ribose pyranase [Spiroplasma sp. SV19]WHQ36339.1 D-ribose pyranase [Spiroplasma sp. SV19]
MYRSTLLNSDIIAAFSKLGHGDIICIADAGLPIPNSCQRIDLALEPQQPSFASVLSILQKYLVLEKVIIAKEMKTNNECFTTVNNLFLSKIPIKTVPHFVFKEIVNKKVKLVIRTGECTAYANIILTAGVNFNEL